MYDKGRYDTLSRMKQPPKFRKLNGVVLRTLFAAFMRGRPILKPWPLANGWYLGGQLACRAGEW